ncbi:hypothetical protein D9758_011941 [Tetrapyrgos nigripes]|uniref:Uncharacterized protein n=1 Tax=Tetrapyrgos nigripes TaxID=182062 RepID=A0A8H5FXF8_9AGAR|nr:hypothetical protein D9758_011941 [Tetrapyrgos nigripes]
MAEIPPINISLVLGPVVVSTLINALLAGVCMVQFLEYYESRIKDRPTITGLVIWVAVVDTFSSLQYDSYIHHAVSIPDTGNSCDADKPTQHVSATSISVPVQFFLAWRIRIFSKSVLLFVVICTLSLAQGALAFATSINGLLEPSLEANARRIPVADSWMAIAAACDASITAVLSYYLWKSKTGMKGEYLFRVEIL